ncbi:N-acetylglucosamine-6-sulfatase-like [Haliotis rubra]|uniref:N-acetylglucosamine-6-sulfatase-like n=1 Tax=Haliotis rubra TaxID=36100 RepID=UPI001EE57386|nr:N-acetylglucosamine-6-sulfatase-like [Haliotis rubra]
MVDVKFLCGILATLYMVNSVTGKPPNIVFILTDDQDSEIGGMTPMVKTKKLIANEGMTFDNMFVATPVCCPSRSSIFTGKYLHNHLAINNSVAGNCSSPDFQKTQEINAFPVFMKQQGYSTFFAGKYLNLYGEDTTGGVQHVPPGWDSWVGLVGNSVYYNYNLSINGTRETHGSNYTEDYLTDVIHRRGMEFLSYQNADTPFFMMLSTPACHEPWTSAPQYEDHFSDIVAQRTGSYNVHGKDKHWIIDQAITPIPNDTATYIDGIYRNRWRTLMSVEDMVEDVVSTLLKKFGLDNTYIFYSSDNGYHIGQFSLPMDKRNLYEFDVRVPLLVRGPGIRPRSVNKENVLNIDFAATFMDLAGATIPDYIDGRSIVPLLHDNAKLPFRQHFLTEYHGESARINPGCDQLDNQGIAWCHTYAHCQCEDAWNNTYTCIRYSDGQQHYKYCEIADNDNFVEMYDLESDPYEFMNIAKTADPDLVNQLKTNLAQLSQCVGASCHGNTELYGSNLLS